MAYSKEQKNALNRLRRFERLYGYDLSTEIRNVIADIDNEISDTYYASRIHEIGKSRQQGTRYQDGEHVQGIAPNNADLLAEIRLRLDDTVERINTASQYDEYFYPFQNQSSIRSSVVKGRVGNRINGLHGGTFRTSILDFLEEKIQSITDLNELDEWTKNLEENASRIIELVDWNNNKVKYADEVQSKTIELMNLLNGHTLTSQEAEEASYMFME